MYTVECTISLFSIKRYNFLVQIHIRRYSIAIILFFFFVHEGFTALHLAVQHHHTEALAVLLDSGRVNVNAIDGKNGRSALYFAAESNDLRATRILLAHNADVSVLSYSGCTAAQMANERSNFELVKLIERQ